jgi:acetate kinase
MASAGRLRMRVLIAVSARHAHLSAATLQQLFGSDYELHVRRWLSQIGQFSAEETVSLVGPRGQLDHVRLMGPPRAHDQVELSRTDEIVLGIQAPLRISGDLTGTPGIRVIGPAGSVTLPDGVITARRHIHMGPADAQSLGVRDRQTVSVRIDSNGRDLTFDDVMVRIAPDFRLERHLDTDEANAAGVTDGDHAELIMHR